MTENAEPFISPGKFAIEEALEEHRKKLTLEKISKSFDRLNSILNPQNKKPSNDYLNTNYVIVPIKYNRTQNK